MNFISTNQFCKEDVFSFVCLKGDEIEHVAGCSYVQMFELSKPRKCLFAVTHIPELKILAYVS